MLPFASRPLGATLLDSAKRKPFGNSLVVEALLLWKLGSIAPTSMLAAEKELAIAGVLDKKKHPGLNLDEWSLHAYGAVTEKLGMLKPDTIALAKLTKDFRNLIHPGRVQRLGEACDRGKALIAVGAMVSVVRDLTTQAAKWS